METLPATITSEVTEHMLFQVNDILNTTEQALTLCESLEVSDHDSFESAGENRNILNDINKELERIRKEITAPLDKRKADVMEFFKRYTHRVIDRVCDLEEAMLKYKKKLDEERQAEQEKLRKEAEAKEAAERERLADLAEQAINKGKDEIAAALIEKADEYRVAVPVLAETKIPSQEVATKKYWHAEVTDFAALEDLYKLPNQKLLDGVATTLKDKAKLPGVRFYYTEGFSKRK